MVLVGSHGVFAKLLLLVGNDSVTAACARTTTEHLRQANLVVDLLHPLEVGLCSAFGSENDVL